MNFDVMSYIKDSYICKQTDKTAAIQAAALWKQTGINIVGPVDHLPVDCRFVITAVDYFKKWPEVEFVPQITAENIIKYLLTLFSKEGYPEVFTSDHGSQFQSIYLQLFLNERGIRHRKSESYRPQANRQVERFNRVFKDFLQVSQVMKGNVKYNSEEFLGVYRSTPHAATKPSLPDLFHNQQMCTRLDVIGFPDFDKDYTSECRKLSRKMEEYQ